MMKSKGKKVERGRRLNVTNNIKKYGDGAASAPKVSIKTIIDRLIDNVEGHWYGADVLYYVQTQKRGISLAQQRSERYLLLVRKKETPKLLNLVQVVCKDTNIEIRRSWDLPLLRAIDLGDDDNEFVLSFDSADYSWFVNGQAERDETVWILAQMCKVICGYDLSLGHHVDMDLIGYATKTNGTLARFPLLQELNSNVHIAGDVFSEEETEAEVLLSELKWVSEAPAELLQTISTQAETLNLEIIDFLLQWEDDSEQNPFDSKSSGTSRDTYQVLRALTNVDNELASVDQWIEEQIHHLERTQTKLQKIENESGALETSYQNLSSVHSLVGTVVTALSLTQDEEDILISPSNTFNSIIQKETLRNIGKTLKPLLDACGKLQIGLCLNGKTPGNIAPSIWKQLLTVSAVSSQRNKLLEISESLCRDAIEHYPKFVDDLLQHSNMNDASKGRVISVKQFTNISQLVSVALLPPGVELFPKHVDLDLLGCVPGMGKPSGSTENASTDRQIDFIPFEQRSLGFVVPKSFFCATGQQVNLLNEGLTAQSLFHSTLAVFKPLLNYLQDLDASSMSIFCQHYAQSAAQDRVYNVMFKTLFKTIQAMLPVSKSYTSPSIASVATYKGNKSSEMVMKYLHSSVFYPSGPGISRIQSDIGKKSKDKDKDAQSLDGAMLLPWTALGLFLVVVGPIVRMEEAFCLDMFQLVSGTMGFACLNNALTADSEAEVAFSRIHSQSHTFAASPRNVMNYEKSQTEIYLDTIFAALKPESAVSSMLPQRSAVVNVGLLAKQGVGVVSSGGGGSSADAIEGVECVGMLVCLQQYLADYYGVSFDGFSPMIDVSVLQDGSSAALSAGAAVGPGADQSGGIGAGAGTGSGLPQPVGNMATSAAAATNYWLTLLIGIREDLLSRFETFLSLQLQWIQSQKSDPKKTSAAVCVSKLPNLIKQLVEMTGKQSLLCVNKAIVFLIQAVFSWINTLAASNEKYSSVVKMHNYGMLDRALTELCASNAALNSLNLVKSFSEIASQEFRSARNQYINWQMSNTFEALSAASRRIESFGSRIKQDELVLYIRKSDIIGVVKEFDASKLEDRLGMLRKALKKHFGTSDEDGLEIAENVWRKMKEQVIGVLKQLEIISAASFQMAIGVGSAAASVAFDKIGAPSSS